MPARTPGARPPYLIPTGRVTMHTHSPFLSLPVAGCAACSYLTEGDIQRLRLDS